MKYRGCITFARNSILVHGDMMAIKHVMNFKGPNGKSPCHACHIIGVQDTSHTHTPLYVLLTLPHDHPSQDSNSYDPCNLPLHSNTTYRTQLAYIQNAHSVGSQAQCGKDYGITGGCILIELPSISISRSFPHDWMHLCLENHGKNLVLLWKGNYKGMDEGSEEYQILDHIWEVISKKTVASVDTIPASFGHKTPNIHTEAHLFTAEDWSFWLVHLAPLILKGHF